MHSKSGRERFAELTSSLGAGILGAGLGILLARYLKGVAIPLLILGGFMHAFGMWDMRRMERSGPWVRRPLWSLMLYWICWLLLIGIGVYIFIGRG